VGFEQRTPIFEQARTINALDREGVWEFLASKQITETEHPPYSPDLAPSDIFLFPKIKEILKGRHFDKIDEIRSNMTTALKVNPKNQFQIIFKGGLGAGIGV
jgi:transposase